MNRILAVVFYLALAGHALAQGSPVKQSGTVTPGHVPVIVTTNVIGDGGAATNGVVTNLGLAVLGSAALHQRRANLIPKRGIINSASAPTRSVAGCCCTTRMAEHRRCRCNSTSTA